MITIATILLLLFCNATTDNFCFICHKVLETDVVEVPCYNQHRFHKSCALGVYNIQDVDSRTEKIVECPLCRLKTPIRGNDWLNALENNVPANVDFGEEQHEENLTVATEQNEQNIITAAQNQNEDIVQENDHPSVSFDLLNEDRHMQEAIYQSIMAEQHEEKDIIATEQNVIVATEQNATVATEEKDIIATEQKVIIATEQNDDIVQGNDHPSDYFDLMNEDIQMQEAIYQSLMGTAENPDGDHSNIAIASSMRTRIRAEIRPQESRFFSRTTSTDPTTAIIVGIVLSVIFVVCGITIICWVCWKKKQSKNESNSTANHLPKSDLPETQLPSNHLNDTSFDRTQINEISWKPELYGTMV